MHLRGGVPVEIGAIGIDVIIEHVFQAITAVRHGVSVRALEIPAIEIVFGNRKTALVYQPMMARAQQQQVIETGLTTGCPVLDVVRIDETLVGTAGESTALVAGP